MVFWGKDIKLSLTTWTVVLGTGSGLGTWPLYQYVTPQPLDTELTATGNRKMSPWQQLIAKMQRKIVLNIKIIHIKLLGA